MEFTIKLKDTELSIVSAALGRMPYQDVADLIQSLQKQIDNQVHNEQVIHNIDTGINSDTD